MRPKGEFTFRDYRGIDPNASVQATMFNTDVANTRSGHFQSGIEAARSVIPNINERTTGIVLSSNRDILSSGSNELRSGIDGDVVSGPASDGSSILAAKRDTAKTLGLPSNPKSGRKRANQAKRGRR
jgi:hypothetical protein